jgi:hypothetical protein
MQDFDLDELLRTMPAVTLPSGVTLSPWRRLEHGSVTIVADLILVAGGREYNRRVKVAHSAVLAHPPLKLTQLCIIPVVRDALAELRAEALIVV